MASASLLGLRLGETKDVGAQYTEARSLGFSFIGVDLFQPREAPSEQSQLDVMLPIVRSDVIYPKNDDSISGALVGFTSEWIDCDSPDPTFCALSETALLKELTWACHLALPAARIPLKHANNPNLAHILTAFLMCEATRIRLWISVPMNDDADDEDNGDKSSNEQSTWHWWNQLVGLAGGACEQLGLLLEVGPDLPEEMTLRRWLSEPVVCLTLPTSIFMSNSRGCPILSKPHQHALQRFFKINTQVMISGETIHEHGYLVYQQYISWIWKITVESRNLYEQHSKGLEDQIQEQLQPLQDNLSSATYGVFEMDPYKYKAYEEAIYLALLDRCKNQEEAAERNGLLSEDDFPPLGSVNPTTTKKEEKIKQVIYILGAGQGPFVDASLQASQRANVPIRLYVIEKNPNALLTLKHRLEADWKDWDVHLVPGDMRKLTADIAPPEKADIFVSELLGSFGDNELSPECLDAAQHLLKDDGISIPASYTSFVAPLQSLRIHLEATRTQDSSVGLNRVPKPLETPYVVRLANCQLLADPQEAFTFVHPRKDSLSSPNNRFSSFTFIPVADGMIHGFAGYFDAVLYGKIDLSIHPLHHSPNMFSWFPMVFPLETPVPVKGGEPIIFNLWRCVSLRHVWYEWAITAPCTSKIHNSAGSAYKIGL